MLYWFKVSKFWSMLVRFVVLTGMTVEITVIVNFTPCRLVISSETWVHIYRSTWCYVCEGGYLLVNLITVLVCLSVPCDSFRWEWGQVISVVQYGKGLESLIYRRIDVFCTWRRVSGESETGADTENVCYYQHSTVEYGQLWVTESYLLGVASRKKTL